MAKAEYDPSDELLVVQELGSASRYPLLIAFARQEGGDIDSSGVLRIPTEVGSLAMRYQTLTRILDRIDESLEVDGEASDALDRAEKEERQFSQFSRDAYNIWHADIETQVFREFLSVVERECPGRTFYRKQLLSAFHLAFSQNACNFSVPGAGKTSVVYAAYSYLRTLPPTDDKWVNRLLIVGPPSSFKAWEDEYLAVFGVKPISRRVSGVISREGRADHLRGITMDSRRTELTLTTYQSLANSEEDFLVFLKNVNPRTMMVLDEAHYIKSEDGIRAAAALRLAPMTKSRVVLTGTPAPNGYEDLSNLFRFIYPARNVIGFPPATLRAMTEGSMASSVTDLKSRIQPFYTRIKKEDLDLPEANEHRVEVPMGQTHAEIYRNLEKRIVPQFRDQLDDPRATVRLRARLIRLRQAAVNPELLLRPLEQEDALFDTGGTGDFNISELEVASLIREFCADRDLLRLQTCREIVESVLLSQGKILIWSYFLGNVRLLRSTLDGAACMVEVLTGSTPVAGLEEDSDPELGTREEIIDRFHEIEDTAILIANPQAVGESISLHKACRTAIYFDRDFNAGRYLQSKDRIHRYNPTKGECVSYYLLGTPSTVDQDIDVRLAEKERRLADLVDSDDIPILTAADDGDLLDLRAILEAYETRKTK